MSKSDKIQTALVVGLCAIGVLLIGGCVELWRMRKLMEAELDYQIDMQLCLQDANKILAPCYLEIDSDGRARWYYNANEGRL